MAKVRCMICGSLHYSPKALAAHTERRHTPAGGDFVIRHNERAKAETILEEAARLVDGERSQAYGHPKHNWADIAACWSILLGVTVTARQALLCMAMMKICREKSGPKRDSIVDIAGYARCIERLDE